MSFITADFETAYGDGLGFKTQTNEEYLRDPRFEVIGVSVKVDDGKPEWFSGSHDEIREFLRQYDWANSALLAHNTMFDGSILAWHFGIVPAFYYDTLGMARAIHGVDAGGSLKALAERYGIGEKGDEVVRAYGKFRADFTPTELAAYGEYCCNDVELTYKLFQLLNEVKPVGDANVMESFKYLYKCGRPTVFPEEEHDLIDMTLRMYIEPTLRVNDALLVDRLEEIREQKQLLLSGLMNVLGCETEEAVRKKLCSNPQFAGILKDMGIEPPMKTSPRTGKPAYAFAKTDEGFLELQEHPEVLVQQLCAVRLGTKSTMEEKRIERFISIGARNSGFIPIPLKYYGAHTGRWSGQDAINFQNLPSRDKKKKTLKNSIVPPPGYVVINCDSSQIEARVLAWLAGQLDLVEQFRRGEDVYSIFASMIFARKITRVDKLERFVGKTCLAADTQVLTRRGWIPIIEVVNSDQLWDGEEWVTHDGVSFMGLKPTIKLHGLELTPDHEILTELSKWETAQYALTHDTAFQSALASVTLPSSDMKNIPHYELEDLGGGNHFVAVNDVATKLPMQGIISGQEDQRPVMLALSGKLAKNAGGNINPLSLMTSIEAGYSTGYPQQSAAAISLLTAPISTMVNEVFPFIKNGGKTGQSFLNTCRRLMGGITQIFRSTVSMLTKGIHREISGSLLLDKICLTNGRSKTLKPVFDILNSGSRNRFTVMTDRGPIIVHNCILGLGYGTGPDKLQHTLLTNPPGAELELQRCKEIVWLYRQTYSQIPLLWQMAENAMKDLMAWAEDKQPYWLAGLEGVVEVTPEGFRLPNSLFLRYPGLRVERSQSGFTEYYYDSRKGKQKLWGGTLVENIVQALARIIVGEQMLAINKRYKVVLTVHDAAVIVVPEAEREAAVEFVTQVMSTPPKWALDLPVACETAWGYSYGECLTDEDWEKRRAA